MTCHTYGWRVEGRRTVIIGLLLAALVGVSLLSLARAVSRLYRFIGATDLHSYWYFGHFVWQGMDPYQAFDQGVEVHLPIRYLDGVIVEAGSVGQAGLRAYPVANTAPILLLLSPLARRAISAYGENCLADSQCFLHPGHSLDGSTATAARKDAATICSVAGGTALLQYEVASTGRVAGQTSLLVFTLMLGALLLRKRHWVLSGMLFGCKRSPNIHWRYRFYCFC